MGAMGLPRDLIEEIIEYHHGDLGTLMACALTCRALFSAVRRLIHRKVKFSMWRSFPPEKLVDRIAERAFPGRRPKDWCEGHLRYLSMAGKRGLLDYAREVQIEIGPNFSPQSLEIYLPHFQSFTQVHTLRISSLNLTRFLPTFEACFAQFVPTLRSLYIPFVIGNTQDVLEFVCRFPHLEDLSLTLSSTRFVDTPLMFPLDHSPPLKGTLILRGTAMVPARFLLEMPGGLHFRSVDVGAVGKVELEEILAACSSNLETLSLRPRSRKFTQYCRRSGEVSF